jgi:iron complex transport system substrate-binding protein
VSVLRFGLLVLGLAAAAWAPPESLAQAPRDDLGRAVRLAAPARRVVSLSPSTTELLFALGAGSALVGRTRWCDYPAAASAIPSVGDGLRPDVELVASRQPDLVVLYASQTNHEAVAQLERLGIATVSVRLDRLNDLGRVARLLGRLVGRQSAADSLVLQFSRQLDSARASTQPSGTRPRVAVVVWDRPPIVIGAGSFLNDLLQLAGARNVFDDLPQPSVATTIEAIAERDPDALLVLGDTVPAFAARAEWHVLRAVRQGRLVRVSGSEFERPTFRALKAAASLRAALQQVARP